MTTTGRTPPAALLVRTKGGSKSYLFLFAVHSKRANCRVGGSTPRQRGADHHRVHSAAKPGLRTWSAPASTAAGSHSQIPRQTEAAGVRSSFSKAGIDSSPLASCRVTTTRAAAQRCGNRHVLPCRPSRSWHRCSSRQEDRSSRVTVARRARVEYVSPGRTKSGSPGGFDGPGSSPDAGVGPVHLQVAAPGLAV